MQIDTFIPTIQQEQYLYFAMYWIIDGFCFVAGIVQFALAFVYSQAWTCWVGIVWIIVYPILLEALINLFVCIFGEKVVYSVAPRSHFVYHPLYNISFCGLENLHPFDSKKYGNISHRLIERNLVRADDFIVPEFPSRSLLIETMSRWYFLKLCYTLAICKYIELPLVFLPGFLLRWRVLDPMLRATQGSILAACAAEQRGWAVNLSGGFHHASINTGGGFCVFPDITLIVNYLRTRLGKRRIMIVDLDAHQGNGYERDLINDNDTYIVDFYNHRIYPGDSYAKGAIRRDVAVSRNTRDKEYIELVKGLEDDLDNFNPDFLIYNAGTDILENDPLGGLTISAAGIVQRDEQMLSMCLRHKVPMVMLLSGGYQPINAQIIANSLENMLKKFG